MNDRFFSPSFDDELADYTHFDEPKDQNGKIVDWWYFCARGPWQGQLPLTITAKPEGIVYDFNMGFCDLPIVTEKVVDIFRYLPNSHKQVQFVPVQYKLSKLYILNVLPVLKCVDELSTKNIMKWTEEDDDPEMVGKYRQVIGLRILPEKIGTLDACRPEEWNVVMVFSERLKSMLVASGVKGIVFDDV